MTHVEVNDVVSYDGEPGVVWVVYKVEPNGIVYAKKMSESGSLSKDLVRFNAISLSPVTRAQRKSILKIRRSHLKSFLEKAAKEITEIEAMLPELDRFETDQDEILQIGKEILLSTDPKDVQQKKLLELFRRNGARIGT